MVERKAETELREHLARELSFKIWSAPPAATSDTPEMLPKGCYWPGLSIDDAYKTGTRDEMDELGILRGWLLGFGQTIHQQQDRTGPPLQYDGDGKGVGTLISRLRVCA